MIKNILFVISFSLLLNWCISLQILAQTQKEKATRVTAIILSIIIGIIVGLIAIY